MKVGFVGRGDVIGAVGDFERVYVRGICLAVQVGDEKWVIYREAWVDWNESALCRAVLVGEWGVIGT